MTPSPKFGVSPKKMIQFGGEILLRDTVLQLTEFAFDQDLQLRKWVTLPAEKNGLETTGRNNRTAVTAKRILLIALGISFSKGCKVVKDEAKYRKDNTTGLRMVAVTKKTCEDSDGFVCKVRIVFYD